MVLRGRCVAAARKTRTLREAHDSSISLFSIAYSIELQI